MVGSSSHIPIIYGIDEVLPVKLACGCELLPVGITRAQEIAHLQKLPTIQLQQYASVISPESKRAAFRLLRSPNAKAMATPDQLISIELYLRHLSHLCYERLRKNAATRH